MLAVGGKIFYSALHIVTIKRAYRKEGSYFNRQLQFTGICVNAPVVLVITEEASYNKESSNNLMACDTAYLLGAAHKILLIRSGSYLVSNLFSIHGGADNSAGVARTFTTRVQVLNLRML